MSSMDASCKAAQENVDASRNLDDGLCLDRTNELGEDNAADTSADTESADREQAYDWYNPPPSSSPMNFKITDIDAVPSPKLVEYVEKPFAELHYLYNYLRVSNEDSCREYAQKTYGERLTDFDWLRVTLDKGEYYERRFEMADKHWNAAGQIELCDWDYFFGKVGLPMVHYDIRKQIFSKNNKLRQAAVHRYHEGLSREDLEYAMALPTVLGDDRRASEIEQVYEAFLQDPSTLDAKELTFVNTRLHTGDKEPVLIPELLGQIQSLLEVSAFQYAMEADITFLDRDNFKVPQQIELQEYWREWGTSSSKVKQHPRSLTLYPDPQGRGSFFRSTLTDVKELRNYATHRLWNVDPNISTATAIGKQVEWAKTFAIMVGDPATADKIELIASTWLAKHRPATNGT